MTLVAAWIRKNSTLRELVIASDSRIGGGESWDACPKILSLPRPATVVAMSGDATTAYSFLLQAINTCELLDGHVLGRTDIGYLANKLRDAYADSRRHVRDLAFGSTKPDIPKVNVVLLGWSWRHLQFEGYSYRYTSEGELRMDRLSVLEEQRPYPMYMFGDASLDAVKRVKKLRKDRGRPLPRRGDPDARTVSANAFFDWESLEVLADVIADPTVRSVGGVPQVVRIYQYGATESFVWRSAAGDDYFGGRLIQSDERFDRRILELIDRQVRISYSDQSISGGSL